LCVFLLVSIKSNAAFHGSIFKTEIRNQNYMNLTFSIYRVETSFPKNRERHRFNIENLRLV